MFDKFKKETNDIEEKNFKSKGYAMKEIYESKNIVVANLRYISSAPDENGYGPIVITTNQVYMFEKVKENGKERYREIFTGFIADDTHEYFNLPYVINIRPLNEIVNDVSSSVPKYGCLILMDEINKSYEKTKKIKRK